MSYQGLRYHLSLPRVARQKFLPRTAKMGAVSSLHWEPVTEPAVARNSQWIKVNPVLSGICGSDVSLLLGSSSPYLAPLTHFPAVLGHEVVARVAVDDGDWVKDTLVTVNPSLSCLALGSPEPCPACANHQPNWCHYRGRHDLGLLMGFHQDYPGGFGEVMWVPKSQILAIPPLMPPSRAVLTEPLTIVLHGLSHVDWTRVRSVLVIGAGTVGLLTLLALAEGPYALEVFSVARYPQQVQWAQRLGAKVVQSLEDEAITAIAGSPAPRMWNAPVWRPSGFDLVIDAAGSRSSVQDALGITAPGGQMLLIGGTGEVHLDLTPLWSRDVSVFGTFGYGSQERDLFSEALALLDKTEHPVEDFVTHIYPVREYREAFQALWNKRSGAIKVCLNDFGE
ncbi:zinc-binding dehydrogenase [Sulfobacillus sp. hq2]|uniref:zinc-dependent alcohol dehydrogenase n=1 Tax=Sulfobacillus TaxID=28033 RepID=UPI000CD09EA8|nr:zinc-binding dehydrogenase [Sulfobacillus sp. hq2]POB09833.1 iditol 2-dehydrogenase [Sulfobacillus sp. hq2]